MKKLLSILLLSAICCNFNFYIANAVAEKADKQKPMYIEADSISVDDANKVQNLLGNVIVTKGTMRLEANSVTITEDEIGYQKGVALAGKNKLVKFQQKRDNSPDYIRGEAEKITFDSNAEVAEMFGRAWVSVGKDEVRGSYIRYDSFNETFDVRSNVATNSAIKQQRVRAILHPRNENQTHTQTQTQKLDLKKEKILSDPIE